MEYVKKIIHAEEVYRKGLTGRGVRIALLDTGVYKHEDLENRVVFFQDYIKAERTAYDDNSHGTHIAGILCGGGKKQLGMAPKAELLVFKILDKYGNGSTKKALYALDWIIENHRKWNIRLLNFSMGYLPNASPTLQRDLVGKLEQLWDEGVIVVTAAGNNGPGENSITVPGVSRKLITVGSSEEVVQEKNKSRKSSIEAYSGRGPTNCCIVKPEILAPGTEILSLSNKSERYERKSGTSMSAPVVCGALALALEKNPNMKPVEMKLLLYDTVDPLDTVKTKVWGILNVDNLVKML